MRNSQNMEGFLLVRKLSEHAEMPEYSSTFSAGLDVKAPKNVAIPARGRKLVYLDLAFRPPKDCYIRIAPRSGLSVNYGVEVGAGVVDPDYTGNVGVLIHNHGEIAYNFRKGDRIAQIICEKYVRVTAIEVTSLTSTMRGDSGFGRSGK